MAFTRVNPGDPIHASQIDQLIDALDGASGAGQPIALTALNDASNYALTVQNDDPTNSRALNVLSSSGTTLIKADVTGVTLGSPLNLPTGSVTSAAIANAGVANVDLGPDVARANLLTNGGFEIWQRGNGPYTASGAWTADRWQIGLSGTDTLSVSMDGTNVDTGSGSIRAAACTFTKGSGTNTSLGVLLTPTDNQQVRGRQVSASIRVRTATASAVSVALGSDGTGGTAISVGTVHTGGGTWQTLTQTYTVPNDATYLGMYVLFNASCTAYVDNAMLVVGTQPANYVPLHPADDLARCLRYFETLGGVVKATICNEQAYSTNAALGHLGFYQKAVVPTVTANGAFVVTQANGTQVSATVSASTITVNRAEIDVTASGLVAGNATVLLASTGTAASLNFEANP